MSGLNLPLMTVQAGCLLFSLHFTVLSSRTYRSLLFQSLPLRFRSGRFRKRMFCAMEGVMTIQGYPRSSILLPIESVYMQLPVSTVLSDLDPILSCFRDFAGFL